MHESLTAFNARGWVDGAEESLRGQKMDPPPSARISL